jgi:peptidoglycan/LPS O-acetylase OafA/YrhL
MDVRSGRFPLVDALRATAALSILGFHLAGAAGAFTVPVLRDLTLRLSAGVTLFFLISGFLLYRPFVRARLRDDPAPHAGVYAWRRFLRIVPAYFVALTALGLLFKPELFERAAVFYGFLQVYTEGDALGGLAVAWSLCVEVAFYAMLPLYALALRALPGDTPVRRLRWELAGLAVLVAVALAFRLWAIRGGAGVLGTPLLTLPAFLDWFALGMGLAVASAWLEGRSLPRSLAWLEGRPGVSIAAGLAAFCLAGAAGANLTEGSIAKNLAVHLLTAAAALGLLAPAVLGDPRRGTSRRFMALRWLAWLGLVSYGVYLWQGTVFVMIGDWTPLGPQSLVDTNLLWLVVAPPLVIVAGALSYYVVERPALLLKRLVRSPRATADQPGAVSAPAVPEAR